jgi:glycosyltransferase involved in cell wall biosynthesis
VGDPSNRILIISQCNSSSPFGEHQRPYYISKYLAEREWRIDHVCPMLKEGVQTVLQKPYMARRYSQNPHLIIRSLKDLNNILGSTRYSLVYVHGIRNQFLLTMIPKRTRTVFDVHGLGLAENRGIKSSFWRLLEKRVLAFPDLVFVTSNRSAHMLRQIGISALKLKVVTNGVDQNKFVGLDTTSRNKIKSRLGLGGKFVIASINNTSEPANMKAFTLLESVASRISSMNNRDVVFLTIGVNETPNDSPKNIRCIGFAKDLNSVLNAADVAVLSYPDDADRTGPLNKTLQFMACELPIVSTINGMRGIENATDGIHYLLSEGNDRDLVEKLLRLKNDPSLRTRLGRNARSLIMGNYTWEKQADKVNDVFMNMVDGND